MANLTDKEAASLAREMRDAGAAANTVRETRRQLRQRKLEPPLPPGWSKNIHIKHKTAEIDDSIIILRNRLVAAPISILVYAKSGDAKAQQAASRVRRFLDKGWMDLNTGSPNAHFVGTDSQVADGCWAAHLTWDQDWIDAALKAEDTDEFLKRSGLPFALETPDPLNVYVDFDRQKNPSRVVTIEKVFVRDLLNSKYTDTDGVQYWLDYSAGSKDFSKSSEPPTFDNLWDRAYTEAVEVATIEDAEHVQRVLLNGPKTGEKDWGLGKWDNLFKQLSWAFIPGDFSNSTDILERWKPLVLQMYAMGQEVNMVRSARVNLGMMAGLPRFGFRRQLRGEGLGPVGGVEKPTLEFNEDGTFIVPEGWELVPFELPADAANALDKAEVSLEMEMARYRPPAALVGRREEGVSSGYQQSLVSDAAMTHLDPPLRLQSDGIKKILTLLLDGARAIKEVTGGKIDKLYVRNLRHYADSDGVKSEQELLELEIDDIEEFELTVTQSSLSPSSRIASIEEGRRARMAGEIDDLALYEEFYGYEDGVEMQKRATEQKMYDSLVDEAIAQAREIIRQEAADRRPAQQTPPTILGPTGEPISGPGAPLGDVPAGAARPGLDATLAQRPQPAQQPQPVGPRGGQSGAGTMT